MKFGLLKGFYGPANVTFPEIVRYLRNDIRKIISELATGLEQLTFSENFEGFIKSVTIDAGQELAIRNELKRNIVPSHRLILRGSSGSQDIVDGDTAWDENYVYLKNDGASTVSATVLFLK